MIDAIRIDHPCIPPILLRATQGWRGNRSESFTRVIFARELKIHRSRHSIPSSSPSLGCVHICKHVVGGEFPLLNQHVQLPKHGIVVSQHRFLLSFLSSIVYFYLLTGSRPFQSVPRWQSPKSSCDRLFTERLRCFEILNGQLSAYQWTISFNLVWFLAQHVVKGFQSIPWREARYKRFIHFAFLLVFCQD